MRLHEFMIADQVHSVLDGLGREVVGLHLAVERSLRSIGAPEISWRMETAETGFFRALAGKRRDMLMIWWLSRSRRVIEQMMASTFFSCPSSILVFFIMPDMPGTISINSLSGPMERIARSCSRKSVRVNSLRAILR